MNRNIQAFLLVLSTAGLATTAQAENFAVGLKAGTTGIGPEITLGAGERIRGRLSHGIFALSRTETSRGVGEDIDFDLDLDISMTQLSLDFHPASGAFRGTAGLVFNGNKLTGTGQPTQGRFDLGQGQYTTEDIGELQSRISFDSAAPYLGIGWGNSLSAEGGFGYSIDIGVVFQGSPDVSLDTTRDHPGLDEDLRREEQTLQDELDSYRFWPVISAGLSWRFH